MKLATFLRPDQTRAIGAVDTGRATIVDLQRAHRADKKADSPWLADMLALIDAGDDALALARDLARRAGPDSTLALSSVRLLAPVPEPRQIRDCNNFEQHMRDARVGMAKLKARLAGKPIPQAKDVDATVAPVNFQHIVYYISNRFNVSGPDDVIEWPGYCEWLDYECEFGVFISKRGKDIAQQDAEQHIFGYTLFNDFSARDQQADEMEGRMGPTKGKSFDTGNSMGPWIVTRDEIPDARGLRAQVRVNGEVWGSNDTATMIHGFDDILAYISRNETLHPGEFIGSGTIGGCCGLEADRWLKDGDVVEIEIDKIGVLKNRVRRDGNAR